MSFQVSSSSPPPPTTNLAQQQQQQQQSAQSLSSSNNNLNPMGGSVTSLPGNATGPGSSPPMGPTTPVPAPYVSPSVGNPTSRASGGGPPPFSLGPAQGPPLGDSPEGIPGAGGSFTAYPGPPVPNSLGGVGGSPPPPGGAQAPGGQQQQGLGRAGTDPTKYKTTICRNWEQSGTCQFRGCTFAHGVDDLRAPTKVAGTSPVLNSVPQATMQQLLTGSTPQTSLRIEQIAELLIAEVNRQRDLVSVHVEANRTLENMLKREQQLRAEATAQLDFIRAEIHHTSHANSLKDREIQQLSALAESQGRRTLDSFATNFNKTPSAASSPALPGGHPGGASAFAAAGPQSPSYQMHQQQQGAAWATSSPSYGEAGYEQQHQQQFHSYPAAPQDGAAAAAHPTAWEEKPQSPTTTDDQLRNILSGLNISGEASQ